MNFINNKIKHMIQEVSNCTICLIEIERSQKQLTLCDCEHNTEFCESCLHHYVIYKVSRYEEVFCPHDGCQVLIDVDGDFYRQLPAQIQKNYKKIHQFYVTANDPTKKLCPS